jgi:hypothetical protein
MWLNMNMQLDIEMENEELKRATNKDNFEIESSSMSQEELLEQVRLRRQGKK